MSDGHKAALAGGRKVVRFAATSKRSRSRTGSGVASARASRWSSDSKRSSSVLSRKQIPSQAAPLIQDARISGRSWQGWTPMDSTCRSWRRLSLRPAAPYCARRGIAYTPWRAAGIAPGVLRRPGIARGQSH